jgi:hypothetical protein
MKHTQKRCVTSKMETNNIMLKKDLENSRTKYMDRAIAAEEKVKRLALALREIRTMVNSGSEEMHIIDEALHPNHAFGGWALNEENE